LNQPWTYGVSGLQERQKSMPAIPVYEQQLHAKSVELNYTDHHQRDERGEQRKMADTFNGIGLAVIAK